MTGLSADAIERWN